MPEVAEPSWSGGDDTAPASQVGSDSCYDPPLPTGWQMMAGAVTPPALLVALTAPFGQPEALVFSLW